MNTQFVSLLAACGITSVAFCSLVGAQPTPQGKAPKAAMSYAKVAPLIKAQCVSCHNEKRSPEKVDLSSYQALMKSGEHGPIVIAGHPEKSKLIAYVDGSKKPQMPMGKPALGKADIELLKKWIAAGAKG